MSPAPKGHPLWGNPLKPKKYEPQQLWDESIKYFEWCNENPWMKKETTNKGDRKEVKEMPTQRPYTIQGLCRFLNITAQTFENYSNAKGYETYFEITRAIRDVIQNNQLEGAIVGTYQSNIIARMLGLSDKVENTNYNYNSVELTKDEIQQINNELENDC